MNEKPSVRPYLKNCVFYALIAYSALSFAWVGIVASGINNNSTSISVFAERLVLSDIAIALFSAVFGTSFLLFRAKKLSSQAKRLIHIVVNYVAAMLAVFALFSNVRSSENVKLNTWIVFFVAASAVYFIIYGAAVLTAYIVRRKKQ